jgi:hypothetical protein
MDPEPSVIRQEIDETRQSLSDKLETLEHQVMDSVHQARATVRDTIDTVKSAVSDTVDSVKRTFDVEYHVQQRPFVCSGLTFVAGFVAGAWVKGTRNHGSYTNGAGHSLAERKRSYWGRENGEVRSYDWISESAISSSSLQERNNRHSSLFSDELNKVKGLAIGTAMALLRDFAKQSLPPTLGSHIDEVMDSATTKLGGQPLGRVIHSR